MKIKNYSALTERDGYHHKMAESLKARDYNPYLFQSLLALNISGERSFVKGCGPYQALYTAIDYHRFDALIQLIDAGADLNIIWGPSGMTPLCYALSSAGCDERLVRFLIDRGADVNLRSPQCCPIELAFNFNIRTGVQQYRNLVEVLLDNGANVNVISVQIRKRGGPFINWAMLTCSEMTNCQDLMPCFLAALKKMIGAGACINYLNRHGITEFAEMIIAAEVSFGNPMNPRMDKAKSIKLFRDLIGLLIGNGFDPLYKMDEKSLYIKDRLTKMVDYLIKWGDAKLVKGMLSLYSPTFIRKCLEQHADSFVNETGQQEGVKKVFSYFVNDTPTMSLQVIIRQALRHNYYPIYKDVVQNLYSSAGLIPKKIHGYLLADDVIKEFQ